MFGEDAVCYNISLSGRTLLCCSYENVHWTGTVTSSSVSVLPGEHTIEMSYSGSSGYSTSGTPRKFNTEAGHTYIVDKQTSSTSPGRYTVLITDKTTGKLVPAVPVITQAMAEQSLAMAEKSIKEHPQNGNFWGEKGQALLRLGRYEESLAAFETCISIIPNSALGWKQKSEALYGLKRYDEALATIDKAILLRPTDSEYQKTKENIMKSIKERDGQR
jgi:tetratricopeptide (TPR) repeat protein